MRDRLTQGLGSTEETPLGFGPRYSRTDQR
jgi:hypothetical protein